jgi:hypothetical protein
MDIRLAGQMHPRTPSMQMWSVLRTSSSCAILLAPKDIVAAVDRGATLAGIAGHARALADGPLVIVGPRGHVEVVDSIELRVHVELAHLDVIVVPAEGLAWLDARDELGPCHEVEDARHWPVSKDARRIVHLRRLPATRSMA